MSARRYSPTAYETYGSVAYAPVYDGSAVRVPRQAEGEESRRQAKTRERVLARVQVEVRQAGQVAPFAVVGFLAVAVFAAMLMFSCVRLTVVSSELIALRSDLSALQAEKATLTAQYEKVFDMDTIEAAVGDTMVRPTGDQVVYIDLSEPDTVEVYSGSNPYEGLAGALRSAGEIVGEVFEYFR